MNKKIGFKPNKRKKIELLSRYLKRFIIAASLLLFTIIVGVVGFVVISDYTLMEAFYMTIITLASVGYGEVKPLDQSGQLFASFLIIFNMGIFAYAISVLSSFLIEGDLRLFLKYRKVYRNIERLRDHTIVCGFGRHGKQVAEELLKNHIPFLVIEPNAEHIKQLHQQNYLFLEGDATHDQLLIEAGIEHAKAIVITFGEDAYNVYTVITARQLNPHIRIITRASDHSDERKLMCAGADHVVMSELIGGFYMATLIHQPQAVEFIKMLSNMGEASIHFREVHFNNLRDQYRNKPLRDVNIRTQTGANIIGLRQANGKYIVNPDPDMRVESGMSLVVLGDAYQINLFEKAAIIS